MMSVSATVREKVPPPEKVPLPYVTDYEGRNTSSMVYDEPVSLTTASLVLTLVLVLWYGLPAPTQVFELYMLLG